MDKEKAKELLQKLVKNFREYEQLSVSMEDTYGIEVCKNYNVQFAHGLREIIKLLGIEHKEKTFTHGGKKYKRISFEYDGVELIELEDYNA